MEMPADLLGLENWTLINSNFDSPSGTIRRTAEYMMVFLEIFVQTAPDLDSAINIHDVRLMNRTVELMLEVQKRLTAQAKDTSDEVCYINVPDTAVMPCGHITSCNVSTILP